MRMQRQSFGRFFKISLLKHSCRAIPVRKDCEEIIGVDACPYWKLSWSCMCRDVKAYNNCSYVSSGMSEFEVGPGFVSGVLETPALPPSAALRSDATSRCFDLHTREHDLQCYLYWK